MIWVLRYISKSKSKSRRGTGRTRGDKPAIFPTYYTDDTGTTTTRSTREETTSGTSTGLNVQIGSSGPVNEGHQVGNAETGEFDPLNFVAENISANNPSTNISLPSISEEDRALLLRDLSENAGDIYMTEDNFTAIESSSNDEKFWELNASLNAIGASPPAYDVACELLNLKLENPAYYGVI
ncbi:hypothetical protein AJ79_01968 [Helicocarpus griseus UAMH5409]|uniref:Uncharacterized protein n=1 Tax=Helicocarpus griseus UAMH5409 TaxID=1447875 RepID=A0A2B7Y5B5_9EURO|nr:hypothetical protein AJ79_01968 [Helicocarpus griseus UAMH5409]